MKAAVLHGNEDLRYEEIETPQPGPGEVRVAVKCAGICGSDVPRVLHNGAHFFPIVLGHEFSGVIEAVGEGVTDRAVGQHVCGVPLLPCMQCADCQKGNYSLCKHYSFIGSRKNGAFADAVVLPAANTVVLDDSIPFAEAALFEPCTVALHGVRCNQYKGGGTVAVLGCGTVGIFTMQWAKIFGAAKVVAFDINQENLDLAKRCGADVCVNTLDEGFLKQAMDLTDGKGYDYVFETAGAVPTMLLSFELAANKAHVCHIGTPTKDMTFTPRHWELMNRKEFTLTGSWMSYSAPFPGEEWTLTAHYFATGQMKYDPAMIYRTFPMSEAAAAFDLFHNRAQVKGRVILSNE